ncbi:sensor histidine kinase [Thermomonas aquatica]|uniref:Signlal transduction histidine kinase, LytS n=1 Tax=Thermomonas aquatica TaxID=2202149 RepID=A0A5B7ZSG1_9GAMM|nr:histidine kinase [Thermomonas aquatica]QDA58111.1 signlal transduction histidine kinase, LytS [Thermomonas aquatica]
MECADQIPQSTQPTALRRRWVLWLVMLVGWTAYGLLYAYQSVEWHLESGEAYSWQDELRTNLVGMWGWIPLAMFLFWMVERHPIRRGQILRACSILMLAAMAVVFVRSCFIYGLDPWVRWYKTPPSFWRDVMPTSLQNNLLLGWIMIGLAHALLYFDRAHAQERHAAELQAQLAQARLDAISAQLNPHFLFNALNSIAELVHHDAARADRMLVGLSALLRRSLDTSRLQWVSLREELELLAQYLDIEKVRLGERMQVHWHVAEDCLDEAVPPLLLQPLVENAVVHAIARRIRPGSVRIGAALVSGMLWLDVEDDGAEGLPDAEGNGIGLSNTRARLQALYGDAAALAIEETERGGTRVGLRLPRAHGAGAAVREAPAAIRFDGVPAR